MPRSNRLQEFLIRARIRSKYYILAVYDRVKHYLSMTFNFNRIRRIYQAIKNTSPIRSPIQNSAHLVLWITFTFIVIFLIWSNFAVLEEVTVATATVIPLSHVQSIQNMEGGIIKDIAVHEGDIVEKSQILVVLDPTRFTSALNESRAKDIALQIKIARLAAESANKPFILPPDLNSNNNPTVTSEIKAQQDLYKSRQDQLKQLQANKALVQQELSMTKPLVGKGAASLVEVIHLERQLLDIQNQIDQFYTHALDDLTAAKGDHASLQAAMLALQDRLNRTTIRATTKGIVKQIKIATIGSVVPPGAEIMSIVPLEDKLLVEAQVKPSDIGFIHSGESVTVKITAYDFTVYGGLTGYVDRVSADTITDARGHSYYIVRVKTDKNYLRTASNPLYIIPGMTATVSILTGKRTVLNYLISPLIRAQENALRER